MPALLLEEFEIEQVLEHRKKCGSYRWVEVWDGTYVVPPLPDNCHAELSGLLVRAFGEALAESGARYHGHINISDRNRDWLTNVRCPDAAVFLPGNRARDRRTHYQGGPDLLVEILMPGDMSRDKLDFYAKVGTREVLIVDRDPWRLELYRLSRGRLRLRGTSAPGRESLASKITPFAFQLVRGRQQHKLKIINTHTGQEWAG